MKNNKHLVIIGDSMCMPRDFDNIPLEQTYPYMLSDAFPEFKFFNRAQRANTFVRQTDAMMLHDDLTSLHPDVTIVNIGMADCAPRLFTLRQNKILNLIPKPINKPIIKLYSRNRQFLTRNFPKVYVAKDIFNSRTSRLFELILEQGSKLIVVGIAPVRSALLDRSYGFKENILSYNEILKYNLGDKGVFIDTYTILDPILDLLPDGFHLTLSGNRVMFEHLRDTLNDMIQ